MSAQANFEKKKRRMGQRRLTQAEKTEATRQALFDAATAVVGKHGYADASIGKITAAAGVAQGTFYYHFGSQQDLFELLLPNLGDRLLAQIRQAVRAKGNDLRSRQEAGFRTFAQFLMETPAFYRVLTEAEVFAPSAYRVHMRNISRRYLAALTRSWENGEIRGYERDDLDVLASILAGAMYFLTLRLIGRGAPLEHSLEEVVDIYMRFVGGGFGSRAETVPGIEREVGGSGSDLLECTLGNEVVELAFGRRGTPELLRIAEAGIDKLVPTRAGCRLIQGFSQTMAAEPAAQARMKAKAFVLLSGGRPCLVSVVIETTDMPVRLIATGSGQLLPGWA